MKRVQRAAAGMPATPKGNPPSLVREAAARYAELHPLYAAFCRHVRQALAEEIAARAIKIHSIEARAKSVESFERKIRRLLGAQRAPRHASEPLKRVTDTAGVRVITYFPRTVADVDSVICSRFRVLEKDNKTESRDAPGTFGYRSVHYLVELTPENLDRPDCRWFQDLVAEIQVRTILQHAWAEIEHDIQYKSARALPPAIRRRLAAVAGLLEIADREFQAIRDEHDRSRERPPADKPGRAPAVKRRTARRP